MTSERKILSEPEAAAIIEDFEKRHDLFSIVVDGISIWRLLRFEIGMQLQNLGLHRIPIARSAMIASLPRAALQYVTARRSVRYIGKTSNSGLRGRDERGYYDIYFDDLIDGIAGGAKMSSLDAGGYGVNEKGAYRKPAFDDTSIIILSALLGRLRPHRVGTQEFARLSTLLARDLELTQFTPEHIARKFSVFQYRRMLYRRVLGRLGARSVLAANTGQHALCMAAHDLGVPFVEMQHGLFTRHHPDCLPDYALEWSKSAILPDLLTVYGGYTAGLIKDTAIARVGRIRPVGNSIIEKGRLIREAEFQPDRQKPVITLTAQGLGDLETANFLSRFLSLYQGALTLNVRLHPGYDSVSEFASSGILSDRRVRVLPGQSMPATHDVIARSDIHLSVFSTCHYDALGIGTPTMVIAGGGFEAVSDLYTEGHARLLSSPEDLSDIIAGRQWPSVPVSTSHNFFTPGYLDNLHGVLEELEMPESNAQ